MKILLLLLVMCLFLLGGFCFDISKVYHTKMYQNKERKSIERFQDKLDLTEEEVDYDIEKVDSESRRTIDQTVVEKITSIYPEPLKTDMLFTDSENHSFFLQSQ